jgi:vitamin B12 transporter
MRGGKATGVFGLLVAGAIGTLAAQQQAQQHGDTVQLAPIVVTATSVPTAADRLANRVTVLTARDLAAAGVHTVADALAGLVGLAVVRTGPYGSGTSLFMRGGESDYVKVLVDGVAVNDPGGAYDFAHLTVDNVDRIEVVRGPVSVLYGSDAVAGVVQVFTRARGSRLDAGARAGTFGTLDADATVDIDRGPLAVALTARRLTSDGPYAFNGAYDDRVLGGRLQADVDARTTLDLSLRSANADYHFPTDGTGAVVDHDQHQLSQALSVGLAARRRLGDRVTVRVMAVDHAGDGGIDDGSDGPGDTLGVFAYHSRQDVSRRSVDGRVSVVAGRAATITVGAAFEHQRTRGASVGDSEYGPFGDTTDAGRRNWAGYGEIAVASGALSLTAGGRLDRNERFGGFVTWRGGVSWSASRAWRMYASAGTAFKEPTFFEQFGGAFVVGNPDLTPERSTSWEVGAEAGAFDQRVRASASYFGQRFRDLIQFTSATAGPQAPNYVNLAAADADGIELELSVGPIAGGRLRGHYTYLRTRVTDGGVLPDDDAAFRTGGRLLRRPTHSAGFEGELRRGRLVAYAALRWIGSRADADFIAVPAARVTLPPVGVADVAGELRLRAPRGAVPGLSLTARVENVFDARYQMAFGFPALGRTVLVGGRLTMQ